MCKKKEINRLSISPLIYIELSSNSVHTLIALLSLSASHKLIHISLSHKVIRPSIFVVQVTNLAN